ncbi:hypothetical protein [Leptothoe kymatousa]|uniref:Oligosaccharide repeat unit polymerase n=1 Tax=Leptothoe kymatousa TAU-MAC 1615 TaxID=2364775 RepID=A0ABS5Y3R7_9CYAN|nr:hypothetical protein [Leptothoe kymatousa]MBT9312467.1 hypothetical protein [Leptothoe kymatousa TAU-MAC 1615]
MNIITFLWLFGWALRVVVLLLRGQYHSIFPPIVIHWLFCGLPLLFEVLVGPPAYVFRDGFKAATSDATTNIIYCIYVSLVPIFWWFLARTKASYHTKNILNFIPQNSNKSLRKLGIMFCFFIIALPVIFCFFSPRPELYFSYAASAQKLFESDAERNFHRFIGLSSSLSALGFAGFLALRKGRLNPSVFLFLSPFIFSAIWLNGKRNIVAVYLVTILFVGIVKRYLKGRQIIAMFLIATIIMSVFSYNYKSAIRGKDLESVGQAALYQDFREDYGRDDVIKTAIFAELNPETLNVLEHRGQTFLLYVGGFLVPRSMWENKPLPFPRYMVSAARLKPIKLWPYGITTSILAESIANFSWIGFLVGPMILALVCRLGDSTDNAFIVVLTTLLACLLNVLHPLPYIPLLALWFTLTSIKIRAKRKYKRRLKRYYSWLSKSPTNLSN